MGPRSRRTVVRLLLPGAALIFTLWGYEYLVGFPKYISGRWVVRHTSWYAKNYPIGFPRYRGLVYYYYNDSQGQEVRHGPGWGMHPNGIMESKGFWLHGEQEGTWTRWDHKGEKIMELEWRDGKVIREFNARKIDARAKIPSKDEE